MITSEQWLKNLENGIPYTPNTKNYKGRRKLPKFNPKDMLFKKELKASK